MTRRLAVLIALLATLLAVPSAASADARPPAGPRGGGTSATILASVATTDPVADDDADAAEEPVETDGGDVDVEDPAVTDETEDDGWGDEDVADDGTPEDAPVIVDPAVLVPVPSSRRTVPGRVARLRTDGRAAIPRSAPKRVKRVLAAANLIVGKPYKWGGGHSKLFDTGYDCSGAVGYALIRAGLLKTTMVSGGFAKWAVGGPGRWISIHANKGHVYMEIAGLRLDTSAVADPGGRKGVRWRPAIGRRTGFHTRHIKGL